MKLGDIIAIAATLMGAVVSFYFALVGGEYEIAIILGIALPLIVWLINRLSSVRETLTSSMVLSLIVGFAVVAGAIIVRSIEISSMDNAIETVAAKNKDYAEVEYPPLPLVVGKKEFISGHLAALLSDNVTIGFLSAPAGTGKTALIKEMVGSSSQETAIGTVFFPLAEFKERTGERTAYGTQIGLGNVSFIDNAAKDGSGLLTVICASRFPQVSEQVKQQWPLSKRSTDTNRERFTNRCRERLESEMQTPQGLRIFIDDLDEIEQSTLFQLIALVRREIDIPPSSIRRKLLILLGGRPEVLFTISRYRLDLFGESGGAKQKFSLLATTISRTTPDKPFFQEYLKRCVSYQLKNETQETRDAVVNAINAQRGKSKNMSQALEYLESCAFVASQFVKLQKGNPFDDVYFGRDFYSFWRNRARDRHGLPPHDQNGQYDNELKKAAKIISQESGVASIEPNVYVLLYSGLVEVLPPTDLSSKLYQIKFEFPQFEAAILDPPWLHRKKSRVR